VLLSW